MCLLEHCLPSLLLAPAGTAAAGGGASTSAQGQGSGTGHSGVGGGFVYGVAHGVPVQ